MVSGIPEGRSRPSVRFRSPPLTAPVRYSAGAQVGDADVPADYRVGDVLDRVVARGDLVQDRGVEVADAHTPGSDPTVLVTA
jgi:hypothetical protein